MYLHLRNRVPVGIDLYYIVLVLLAYAMREVDVGRVDKDTEPPHLMVELPLQPHLPVPIYIDQFIHQDDQTKRFSKLHRNRKARPTHLISCLKSGHVQREINQSTVGSRCSRWYLLVGWLWVGGWVG